MYIYFINKQCINCGICKKKCPTNAIKNNKTFQILDNLCIGCSICYKVCPIKCISFYLSKNKFIFNKFVIKIYLSKSTSTLFYSRFFYNCLKKIDIKSYSKNLF
jgi:ferredoxin